MTKLVYRDPGTWGVRNGLADITKDRAILGLKAGVSLEEGHEDLTGQWMC